jgi:trimeric autotransporter adhesin
MIQSRFSGIFQPTMRLCRRFAILAVAAISVFSGIAHSATLTVTSNADSGAGSLRAVLASAGASDTIVFSGVSSIVLASPISVPVAVTIAGPGANLLTISGNNVTRIFNVTTTTAATISGVTLTNGLADSTALRGGAINNTGSLVLDGVALRSNSAFDGGGAIYNVSTSASTGQLRILNSEISGNTVTDAAGIGGGGILSTSTSGTAASVVIINSTISGNTANANTRGMVGGGIYFSNGALGIFSTTIANNRAGTAGGNIHVATLANTTLSVRNSIVTGGIVDLGGVPLADTDIFQLNGASINSLGYNIITRRSGATGYAVTDAANATSPSLGALALNVGTTRTMLPNVGSLALGFVPTASCVDDANVALTRDQNGVTRPVATSCDAGATQTGTQAITFGANPGPVVFAPSGTFTVTATGGLSGNPVTFTSTTTSVCTTGGTNGSTVTIATAGTCTIAANQAGNNAYAAAAQVTQSITINQGSQTIIFGALSNKTFGDAAFTVSATGGASGSAVIFASQTTNVCTTGGTNGATVTIVAVGTCTIRASQAGSANYAPAPNVDQGFTVVQATQTITFGTLAGKTFGDAAFTVSATGGASGSAVTFASQTTNVCTTGGTNGATVTIVAVGTCTIRASQAGTTNYAAALSVDQGFTVAQATQTITFGALTGKTFGDAAFTVSATGGASGNPVTFASQTSTVCTTGGTNGSTITIASAGTCTIRASQAGTTNYTAALSVDQGFTVAQATQTITFGALTGKTFGDAAFTVSATGGASTNPVTFASQTSTVCTTGGTNGSTITIASAGTCTIRASQTGTTNYAAALSVDQGFTVAQATQAITFGALAGKTLGDAAFTVSATGGASTNPVTFASQTTNVCTTGGTNGATVTLVGAGTCTIRASQAGNTNYALAPSVDQGFTVGQGSQTITFGALAGKTLGDAAFTVSATGGASANAVTFASQTTNVCTTGGTNGSTVTLVGAGTCTIRASQAGNANYTLAPNVDQGFTVAQGAQTITFAALSNKVFGDAAFIVSATGGASGNPVTFASQTTNVCTTGGTNGATVTIVTVGTCTIRASQVGNTNYAAAPDVDRGFTIGQGAQTITFAGLSNKVFGDAAFTVSATGGASGNAVTFASQTTNVCTTGGTNGATVSIVAVGTCTIRASQAGTTNYTAAPTIDQSFTVGQAAQTITFGALGNKVFGDAAFTASATGGASTNPVTFASQTTTVCTTGGANGSTVTIVAVGTCTIRASQAGNTNYAAATNVDQGFTVGQATQTIAFTPPASVVVGAAPIVLTATGGASMLPVTFASQTATICTTTGTNGSTLTFLVAGICTVRASQAGNASFLAAADVNRNISIGTPAPPPSPPAIPQVACVIKPAGGITCGFAPGTPGAPGLNTSTITGYQISCANPNGVVIASQSSTGSALNLPTLPVGSIYTCTVTAMSSVGSSNPAVIRLAPKGTPLANRAEFDFDGLGFAAVLVRGFSSTEGSKATTATSQVGRWDGTKLTFTTIADVGADWNVLGLGDITSTGKSALISRNAAANVRIDLNLPPTATTSGIIVRDARLDWVVEAVGDLDGDGKADILWRYIKPGTNDSGVTFAWFMDGTETTVNVNEVKHRGGAPLSWSLAGIIDLNGDKLGDIVWVSPTNQVRALMGQTGRTWSNQLIGQLPVGYSILKLGDVDGDGKADIVMRDSDGNVKVWLMNGSTIRSAIDLPTTDKRWQFYAAGDFDGNGTMDIVWLTPDGSLTLWLVNPTNVAFPTIVPNAGTAPAGLVPIEP